MRVAPRQRILEAFVLLAWISSNAIAQVAVTLPDGKLEAAVRYTLSKPTGSLTVTDLQSLGFLDARGLGITNLSGLEWATGLTNLNIAGNLVSNISPLAGLSNLLVLDLGANAISRADPLSSLTNLSSLSLYGNPVSDVRALAGLGNLRSLILYSSRVSNITPLAGLTNLEYLELRWNPLTNSTPVLAALTNLTTLYLGGTSLRTLDFTAGLTKLSFIDLDHNLIDSLSPLSTLSRLSGIDVGYNPLSSLAPLSGMTNLTMVYVSGAGVSNLNVFVPLVRLRLLMLAHDAAVDLSPLAGLPILNQLGLPANPNVDYATLAGLPNLRCLWLDGNAITNLSPLARLSFLRTVALRDNDVSDLSLLNSLTNLVAVFADGNRLTNVAALAMLPALSQVGLARNLLDTTQGSPSMTVIQGLLDRRVTVRYLPQDQPPVVSVSSNWLLAAGSRALLPFYISDDLTPTDELAVKVESSNTNLLPGWAFRLGGQLDSRRLIVIPPVNAAGTATLRLTVADGAGLATTIPITVTIVPAQYVTIPDPHIEAAVRSAVPRLVGGLTTVDLQSLFYLSVPGSNVTNLSGLEWATNLATLYLTDNLITDLTPLRNLVRLNCLALDNNRITDLSPLSGLTNLSMVSLANNYAADVRPLLGWPRLTYAGLQWNVLDVAATNSADLPVIRRLQQQGVEVDYQPQRAPPGFTTTTTNWIVTENQTAKLYFTVSSGDPGAESLVITARSSDPGLLPPGNITVRPETSSFWSVTVTPASDRTGPALVLLVTTNAAGLSTAFPIPVTVTPPPALNSQAANLSGLSWIASANAPWFEQTAVSHDGVSAFQSGPIQNGEQSWLGTTIQGPGILSFWWKVSSETNRDLLQFEVDGVLQPVKLSGEMNWRQRSVTLSLGSHTLRWLYSKDPDCCSVGADAGWLDQVAFTPSTWLEPAGRPAGGQNSLMLHPSPGRLCEVQVSTNLINWFTVALVVPTNAAVPFVERVTTLGPRFYRLHELPVDSIRWQAPTVSNGQVHFVLHSPPGLRFDLQVSPDLVNWRSLGVRTNAIGTFDYTDSASAAGPGRFYRAVALP